MVQVVTSAKSLARLGGLLYLVVAVGGAFSEYVRVNIDPAQHAGLFRAAFVTDLLDFTCFLGVGIVMYALLKPVSPRVAFAMVVVNAVSVAIQAVNMVNHVGALLVATDPRYTAGLGAQAAHSLVLLLLELHRQGYLIAQIFFGLFLLPLGYLVLRSGYFPRLLGAALMVGSGGYVGGVAVTFLSPGFESGFALYLALFGGLCELAFLLWLLIRGAREVAV